MTTGWPSMAGATPSWWERAIDSFIHSELLLLKLPVLFLMPGLQRRASWPDELDKRPSDDGQRLSSGAAREIKLV